MLMTVVIGILVWVGCSIILALLAGKVMHEGTLPDEEAEDEEKVILVPLDERPNAVDIDVTKDSMEEIERKLMLFRGYP